MPTLANNKRRFFEQRKERAATCGRNVCATILEYRKRNGTRPRGHYAPATIRTTLRAITCHRSPLAEIARFYNQPCAPSFDPTQIATPHRFRDCQSIQF